MNCMTLSEYIALAENFDTMIFSVKLMHDCIIEEEVLRGAADI